MRSKDDYILKDDCRLYHLVEKLEQDPRPVAQAILRVLIAADVREVLFVAPRKKLDKKYRQYIQNPEVGTMTLFLSGPAILHMLRKGHLGCSSRGGHCDPVALSANELKLIPRVFAKPDKIVKRGSDKVERLKLEITRKMWNKTYVLVVTPNKRLTRAHVLTFYNGLPIEEKAKLSETEPRKDIC